MPKDGLPLRIEATGLLSPSLHGYHQEFANLLMRELHEFVPIKEKNFMDGMPYLRIGREPKHSTVVIPFWGVPPLGDNILRLKATVNAVRRKDKAYDPLADKIIVVAPYIGTRSDHPSTIPEDVVEDHWAVPAEEKGKVVLPGEAIYVEVLADIMGTMDLDYLIVGDLHSKESYERLKEKVGTLWHLSMIPFFADYAKQKGLDKRDNVKVFAPDEGSVSRAMFLANLLGLPVLNGEKFRPAHDKARVKISQPEAYENATLLTIDDVIDTFNTILSSLETLRENGVKAVHGFSSAAQFTGPAIDRVRDAFNRGLLQSLVVTNTLPSATMIEMFPLDKVHVVDVSKIFIDAVGAAVRNEEPPSHVERCLFDFSPSLVPTP